MNVSDRNTSLDLVRGVAALAVCLGHLRAVLFIDYAQLETSSLSQKFFYASTSLGHEAVMVFFVLSGYFVGGSVLKQSNKFNWLNYTVTRLIRLWIVLIPALFFTLIIDSVIQLSHYESLAGAYNHLWSLGPTLNDYHADIMTFVGNVFFQQTVFVSVFGTNSPVWSLSNEFYYYVFFPLLLLSTGSLRQSSKVFRSFSFLLICSLFIFFIGAMVNKIKLDRFSLVYQRVYLLISLSVFLFSLYLAKSNILFAIFSSDFVVGIGFTILLFSLINLQLPTKAFKNIAAFSADISYSLYLTHFPLVILIASLHYTTAQLSPNLYGIGVFTLWLSLIILFAVIFWWLFERHTNKVRRKILSFFN